MEQLKQQQHRDSTKKNYLAVWKVFNEFFIRLDYKPTLWEDRLNLFVGYLIQGNKKSTTVKCYVSAVKAILLMNDVKISEDRYLLSSLVKACRIKNDVVRTRLPIQKGMLCLILHQVQTHFSMQPYLAALYRAMISTMYFGLLRISEVCQGPHSVKASDVHIKFNKKKLLLVLRSSKTHGKHMDPQVIKISSTKKKQTDKLNQQGGSLSCLYELLQIYTKFRGGYKSEQEPFFMLVDGLAITAVRFNLLLKKFIRTAGFNANLYSSHSLRAGRSCDLFKLGLSVESIKKFGRWKSNTVYWYIKC